MMDAIPAPIAVSGLKAADKIRAVIYANDRLAHAPLPELLKLAVQTGQAAAGGAESLFIRFGGAALIQCGRQPAGDGDSVSVRFPIAFADSLYFPFLCAETAESAVCAPALVAASRTPQGFAARLMPLAAAGAAARPSGLFWLAIGCNG